MRRTSAADAGAPRALRALLAFGADASMLDVGNSALTLDVLRVSVECVRLLLEACPELLESRIVARWSALHEASWVGEKEAVEVLMEMGAGVNARACYGRVPREVAKGGEEGEVEATWFLSF